MNATNEVTTGRGKSRRKYTRQQILDMCDNRLYFREELTVIAKSLDLATSVTPVNEVVDRLRNVFGV